MSVVSVQARSFILALFIRDDDERFLLGDDGFEFKDSQLHFAANTIENDEVAKQGTDGTMLAGQVRRSSVQDFDGYVGDAADPKVKIEQMRRDFIGFFATGYHFRVIYVDCNRNAWQRKGGYIVDAPEVKELWQLHPEYHVGLNFEDVNYYSYDENEDGEEILANVLNVPISTDVSGGLEWDNVGAISESAVIEYDAETAVASGTNISISDAVEAPFSDIELKGDIYQNGTPTPDAPVPVKTVTGENVVKICGKNLFDKNDASAQKTGLYIGSSTIQGSAGAEIAYIKCSPNTTYTISKVSSARFVCATTQTEPAHGVAVSDRASNWTGTSITITTSATAKYIVVFYYMASAETKTKQEVLNSLQVELGSTATTYEPYQGQSYEVNLGKNLFDKDNSAQILNNIYIHAQGMGTNNGFATVYIPCDEGAVYTISKVLTSRFSVGTTAAVPAIGVIVSSIASDNSATKMTYTTGAGSRYLVVQVRSASDTLTVDEIAATIQIEKGSQATSYAAYFTPIELCKIGTYQDYIYKSGDKWYMHKAVGKYVYNNDLGENGISSSNVSMLTPALNVAPSIAADAGTFYSNMLTATVINDTGIRGTTSASKIRVQMATSFADSYAGFRTLAAANNLTVWYPFATPTDTEITNEALVPQLEAILSQGSTYAGTNNITTIISTGNAKGELEITYYTKYDINIINGGYVWEEGGEGGPTTVINNSITNVPLTWTVFGPATNPTLENTTTGEALEYVGTVADGQTLVIDMGEQTAMLDGTNVISDVTGDYVSLAPGTNILTFSAIGDTGASKIGWSEIVG